MIVIITDKIKNLESSPTQKDSPNPPYTTTVVPANRIAPPFYGGKSAKIDGMWTLKHDNSSPIFFELLIKTEL